MRNTTTLNPWETQAKMHILLAGLLALTVVFVGCDDGGGGSTAPTPDMAAVADTGGDGGGGDDGGRDGGGGDATPAPDMDTCNPGTEDCRCLMDGSCRVDGLICVSNRCIDPNRDCDPEVERCPPADPICYTPCRGDLLAEDGTVRVCSNEGLMVGCLGENTCIQGSCVPAEGQKAAAGTCGSETECPDFQTCIRGRCFSDCEVDGDCDATSVCHRHVCRQQCNGQGCAGRNEVCQGSICLPLAPAGAPEPVSAGQGFQVDRRSVQFASDTTEGSFFVINVGTAPIRVQVRKADELAVGPDGTLQRIVDQPLLWVELGAGDDAPARVQTLDFDVPARARVEVHVAETRKAGLSRWEGGLEVAAEGLGAQALRLVYNEDVAGRWTGTAYAFGNFPDGARPEEGVYPLDAWRADRGNAQRLAAVPNAFVQAWGRFRNGNLGLPEMAAVVDATLTGSWDFPRVRALCRAANFEAGTVCAPFGGTGSRSVIAYSTSAEVPSGIVEMDFALNLRAPTAAERTRLCDGAPHCVVGRIDSTAALQYGGNPEVALIFSGDPAECARRGAAGCTVDLVDLQAEIGVAGRFRPADRRANPQCEPDFATFSTPWLVPGLAPPGGSVLDDDGYVSRVECLDERFVGGPGAQANPIADGAPRLRHLELIDGNMVEQHVMSLVLRETVDAFHGGEPLATYLYVVLQRSNDEVAPGEAVGNPVPEVPAQTIELGPTCSAALTQTVFGRERPLAGMNQADASRLALAVAAGSTAAAPPLPAGEEVHSLCVWQEDAVRNNDAANGGNGVLTESELIRRSVVDAGPDGDRPCFPGATIVYFTVPAGTDPAHWDCNSYPEACLESLVDQVNLGDLPVRLMESARELFPEADAAVQFNLVYRCANPDQAACSNDRYDLTNGKVFGRADNATTFFPPLSTDIADAFRYKTHFVDRTGGAQVGFAPTLCQPGGRLMPYCYDPVAIEAVRDRVDCATALYTGELAGRISLTPEAHTRLRTQMVQSFSALQVANPFGDPIVEFGFERLYAELMIMLGDDAYTSAFASRFDLAGVAQLAFEGSRFEAGGIDLSGAAGYEMYKLHQAAQYYDLVLERFHSMAVPLWQSLEAAGPDQFLTSATVTTWLDRVIRASTQSAAAWSEIARRYQGLNRSDLARSVLIRSYTRAWQESLILRAFMRGIMANISPADLPQVTQAIDRAQIRYRVAMLDMKNRFQQMGASTDAFGLPPDFIPFPALDEGDVNGFEVILDRAMRRLQEAEADEINAIASRRDFDVDQASFQSELVTLRTSYDERLGAICGTFLGEDGRIYPAITRYAHLGGEDLAALDDPCGAVGNGSLWLAGGDMQGQELALQRVRQEVTNAQLAMFDSQEQVIVHCNLIAEDVGQFLSSQGVINGLERDNDRMASAITQLDKVHDIVSEVGARFADLISEETPWGQGARAVSLVTYSASATVNLIATSVLEGVINVNQARIREVELAYESYSIGRECDYLQADLVYTLREQHRDLLLAELDVLNAVWNIYVEFAKIQELANERTRLEAEWRDAEQLAINVAAARSDPNVRIFKNDAIINADRSFESALREAWKATRMYEYYTASSYADREKLFLVRLVNAGDINLRRYLLDLEDDFFDFEQTFGNPDTRVTTVSMRDDVIDVPRYGDDGHTLSTTERIQRFRDALQDPARLDDDGALALKFSTAFDTLSPRTANHKILFIEVEIFGEHGGDSVGRVYLSQQGTGVVEGTDATRRFFTFPPRTAVMNPFFNGERAFGQDSDGAIAGPTRSIYRSYRFRERPLVQTDWRLVIDQRNESVNRDINLAGLDDIVVYVYYTDFTRD